MLMAFGLLPGILPVISTAPHSRRYIGDQGCCVGRSGLLAAGEVNYHSHYVASIGQRSVCWTCGGHAGHVGIRRFVPIDFWDVWNVKGRGT